MIPVIAVCCVMSLVTFIVFGADKYRAKKDLWRIRERTLFILALLGGGVGAYLGMKVFHHKTLHRQFVIGIPAIMIVQLALIAYFGVRSFLH